MTTVEKLQELIELNYFHRQIGEHLGCSASYAGKLLKKYGLRTNHISTHTREKVAVACSVCRAETTNPKFCSQSCAATYNNTRKPKRRKSQPVQKVCKYCRSEFTIEFTRRERVVCDLCKETRPYQAGKDASKLQQTVAELKAAATGRYRPWTDKVRHYA